MAVEERPKVALVEAPTVTIGDINDITGTIADKDRRITAKYMVSQTLIESGTTLAANTEKLTNAVSVSNYEKKTISGWANFDGTVKIYVAPVSGMFHPYPYCTQSISSGETFSFSFTECAAEVKVGITPSATGTCGVWLLAQV